MAKECYVICSDSLNPYHNLALEEYLLSQVKSGSVILYLWQNAHTVVIGRNQNPWAECRISLLQEEGGHLARRLSGGGAVYHDLGNLNFTFLCREEDYDLPKQLSVIQSACALTGIQAEFSGRNDLLTDGRKFSGNAFYHKKGAAYHHGTLLVDTDMEKLGRYLSPPKAKLQTKGVASVRARVINLKELSPTLTCEAMKGYMASAFGTVYGSEPKPFVLSEQDRQSVLQLQTRYGSEEWLFGKPMPFSCELEGHFTWGHLQLQLQIEGGIIQNVAVYTDAMDCSFAEQLSAVLTGCAFRLDAMEKAFCTLENGTDLCQWLRQQEL